MLLGELHDMIKEVCPIDGLNMEGEIWHHQDATEEQKQAAMSLMYQHLETIEG